MRGFGRTLLRMWLRLSSAGRSAWGFFALSMCLAACQHEDAKLFEISSVGPDQLERGDTLQIQGVGFPVGKQGEVTLRGVMHVPGAGASAVQLTLPALASSSDHVELPWDDAATRALPARGSFEGSLTLRFAMTRRAGFVSGTFRGLRFDVSGPWRSPGDEQRLRDRAQAWLSRIGVRARDADSLQTGLVIDAIEAGSLAERAGLQVGDAIVRASGVRVHALSDLASPLHARATELEVVNGRTRIVTLPLPGHALSLDDVLQARVVIAVGVGLLLLFLGPWSPPSAWLARWRSRYRVLPAVPTLGELDALSARPTSRAWLPALLSALMSTLLAWLLITLVLQRQWSLDALSLSLGFLALTLLAQVRSLRGWPRLLAHGGVVSLVFATADLARGTRSLSELVDAQGAAPWTWSVFACPPLTLGFVLLLVHASRWLSELHGAPSVTVPPLRVALELCGRHVCAVLAASVFLGGWNLPNVLATALSGVAGAPWLSACAEVLLLAAKAFLASWLFGVCAVLDLQRRRVLASLLSVAAVSGGAFAWLLWPPAPAVELAIGQAMFALLAATLLLAALHVRFTRHPQGQAPSLLAPGLTATSTAR